MAKRGATGALSFVRRLDTPWQKHGRSSKHFVAKMTKILHLMQNALDSEIDLNQ